MGPELHCSGRGLENYETLLTCLRISTFKRFHNGTDVPRGLDRHPALDADHTRSLYSRDDGHSGSRDVYVNAGVGCAGCGSVRFSMNEVRLRGLVAHIFLTTDYV